MRSRLQNLAVAVNGKNGGLHRSTNPQLVAQNGQVCRGHFLRLVDLRSLGSVSQGGLFPYPAGVAASYGILHASTSGCLGCYDIRQNQGTRVGSAKQDAETCPLRNLRRHAGISRQMDARPADGWLRIPLPGRCHERLHISTRQNARIVRNWVTSIGLEASAYGTHSMRRTKVTQIYKKTGNLRAVQLLLGHTKMDSTVRYLDVDLEEALAIAEAIEI